jgi:FlaG/FlaF family flagellin (archaellin)
LRFSVFPVRVLAAAVATLALGAGFLLEARSPRTAAAIDYGTVTPGFGFIIEGHKAVIPITMTTCTTPQQGYCRLGAYEMKMSFDSTKFTVVSDAGMSTGNNTNAILRDSTKNWKINQWAGSAITFTAGPVGGTYQILSNTVNSISINTNAPNVAFPSVPTTASAYEIGGFTDGGFLFSTGRSGQCFGPTYGTGWAERHCSTNGAPPDYPNGAYGTGVVAALAVQAGTGPAVRGQLVQFNLNNPTNSFVLQITGTTIAASYPIGTRRIVICTDPNHDTIINSIDIGLTAAAFGKHPGEGSGNSAYLPEKDPDINNVINSADLGIVAVLFNKRCTQQ